MSEASTAEHPPGGAGQDRWERQPLLTARTVLRGVAQVDFMPSAITGILFVVALFVAGWPYGLYGLLGAAVATGTAYLAGVDHDRITTGLEGFNGCLVALSFAVFLGAGHLSTFLLAVGGSVTVVVVTSALVTFLGTWNIPTFTMPFCLLSSAMTIAAPSFFRIWHEGAGTAALPAPSPNNSALSWTDIWHGFFANVGEIFFMAQWYVGLIFLIGIFAASRLAGAMACLGSAVALITAWALGAAAHGIEQGLMGYNAVLVAMAVCGVFVRFSGWSVGYAVIGAAAATALTAALTNFFDPFGGHTFTWPFVLTALVFVAAVPSLSRLRRT